MAASAWAAMRRYEIIEAPFFSAANV